MTTPFKMWLCYEDEYTPLRKLQFQEYFKSVGFYFINELDEKND
jgi:hypothetical protein